MDNAEEMQRLKKERAADAAAASAFAKVQPMLNTDAALKTVPQTPRPSASKTPLQTPQGSPKSNTSGADV
eukprot:CAMPEP_0198143334 /NCGR_PEP_ID=MMETSP1443-20131203/6464_1 /TAXON_ID=186043 /ORGANISM="Entomoneis sp., Strain CCMP2396" /LENGTH=69 /DNA_ID=CAMNT_0043806555 /DNA_START=215 /DNA_END=424 /DNA_ORIENTATION=-